MSDIKRNDNDQSPWVVFLIFLRLGLTSFGGPIAHLGYFHQEFVKKRRWLTDQSYGDLVALCQFLPGPASSQVGIALGLSRSGYSGAVAAWLGFTLPSAIILILFAMGITGYGDSLPTGVLHGLKVVAVSVVVQAVWGMARNLCSDTPRITIMVVAACIAVMTQSVLGQVGIIFIAAGIGVTLLKPATGTAHDPLPIVIRRRTGLIWLSLFFALLVGLPLAADVFPHQSLSLVDAFYRAGSLVFGGGHVVLPLLQAEVVPSGWVSNESFLAGYGAAQAVQARCLLLLLF
ncbi:chromate efflux transporter [Paraglaciecola aquimarina]|uniref:chromate efflux transporter n=1 Tax=Paraglaciecola aquimarina TaxID=1235557 RepID=UPI003D17E5DF